MSKMSRQQSKPVATHATKIEWPQIPMPDMKKTKTGDAVMGEEHAVALKDWYTNLQQTLDTRLSEISKKLDEPTAVQSQTVDNSGLFEKLNLTIQQLKDFVTQSMSTIADATRSGILSAADWIRFNDKPSEAPKDGSTYGRRDGGWNKVGSDSGSALPEAPTDGGIYGRKNSAWGKVLEEAPTDGATYGRNTGEWVVSMQNPPDDGFTYQRRFDRWVRVDNDNPTRVRFQWLGNGTLFDERPLMNDGANSDDVTFGVGLVGQAISFPGTGYVYTLFADTPRLNMSITCWFKTESVQGGSMFSFQTTPTATSGIRDYCAFMQNDGTVGFGFYASGAARLAISDDSFNDGQWHCYVATWSDDGSKVYIDGALVASNATTGAMSEWRYGPAYWRIGNGEFAAAWGFSSTNATFTGGLIEDARVYYSELSLDDVILLVNQGPA